MGCKMDFHRLMLVMGKSFCEKASQYGLEWLQINYPDYEVCEGDVARARFLNSLRDRVADGRIIGYVDHSRDPYAIMFNWCILYMSLWDLRDSWERFRNHVEKMNIKSIKEIDGWEDYFVYYFEYIHRMVDAEYGTPFPKNNCSFVAAAIPKEQICLTEKYKSFLEKVKLTWSGRVDNYFMSLLSV